MHKRDLALVLLVEVVGVVVFIVCFSKGLDDFVLLNLSSVFVLNDFVALNVILKFGLFLDNLW